MPHKIDPTNVKPCWHMQTLVSAWIDGRLTGLARWYTEAHVKDCPQCQVSVPFLKSLHFRLSDLGQKPAQDTPTKDTPTKDMLTKDTLTEQQWQAVEAAWEQAEQQK